jgi:hypothetical protein
MPSYAPPKSWESQLWEFQDSQMGVPGQKAIWMWPPWKVVEYSIRGKVVASPSPGHGEFCVSELPVAHLSTKSASTMH